MVWQSGACGSGNGQFNQPRGVTVDAEGNIYVADTGNQRIVKFDAGGNYQTKWGTYGTGNGQFNFPGGVAVDPVSGDVFVADTLNHRIQKFTSTGAYLTQWGTTGTGKSCTTALILRSILDKNPNAHIVLLDPHNEYATAFGDWAEIISPRNMQLPAWLLTFEEFIEVLLGNTSERKQEVELLQELIPLAKARYTTSRSDKQTPQSLRRGMSADTKFTVDTPVPYRTSDLVGLIDERMGRLENKKDIAPYRNIKQRLEYITQDPRYGFMFGSLTVYDGMAQILSRMFRVPVNDKPISILELTGLPTEIVNVVVSVICRMTFDFALWSEGKVLAYARASARSSLGTSRSTSSPPVSYTHLTLPTIYSV